jgi:hypothetical protein
LGAQVWVRPDDNTDRVEMLFDRLVEAGVGRARLFLVWPWVEPDPGEWTFRVYDDAFDAAAARGLTISATLTANSGPWHVGTPSMLHSHTGFLDEMAREAIDGYVTRCARRYADHPALGRWILWNEPNARRGAGGVRTDRQLAHWRTWLADRYEIDRLNRRWRTGYDSFDDIPFPEEVPAAVHRGQTWNAWAPWLADWRHRAAWLVHQIEWVRDALSEVDPDTPTCVNPGGLFANSAATGRRLGGLAGCADVLGASCHPPWHFTFARRWQFPALVAASVRRLAAAADRLAVTEVQTGSTFASGHNPGAVSAGEVVRLHLAGLAAGAASVTGWCFNARSRDWEAGDWALLDEADGHSPRSRALGRLAETLSAARERTGAWSAPSPRAWVVAEPDAQAQEWLDAGAHDGDPNPTVPGRLHTDGSHGSALLAVALMTLGLPVGFGPARAMPTDPHPDLVVASHQVAYPDHVPGRLLEVADAGGTVLFDGLCGRKDDEATLNRPWPGGLCDADIEGRDLDTDPDGHAVTLGGERVGRWPLARVRVRAGDAWSPRPEPRFADGEACVLDRRWGAGRLVYARGPLGPALVHHPPAGVRHLLATVAPDSAPRPVSPRTVALPVDAEHGRLSVLLGPDPEDRDGPLRVAAAGHYHDLWSGDTRDGNGDITLRAPEGTALLWTDG